jgi:epoxyqueuosine reductase QueG
MSGPSPVFRGTAAAEAQRRAAEAELATWAPAPPARMSAAELRRICLDAGADDAGFVEVDRPALGDQSEAARRLMPSVKTLVSLVGATNRENIVSPSRPSANYSWHHTGVDLSAVGHRVVRALNDRGVRGLVTSIGFPMDMDRWERGAIWEIAHKPIAVEAGMGHMGLHRNVIHPRLGNFILLETLLVDVEVDAHDRPLDYNPCADCNLCVAACPVGAISRQREFDFFACLTHNYREFLTGFQDWVDGMVDATSGDEYRTKFREGETLSMWQSLGHGPQYKSAYCMAVCPAGEDVIGPYLRDKRGYVREVVRPLQTKPEPVYVQRGTHAERVAERNPAKDVRYVGFAVGVASVENVLLGLRHVFDKSRAAGPVATVELVFDDAGTDGAGEAVGARTVTATVGGGHLRLDAEDGDRRDGGDDGEGEGEGDGDQRPEPDARLRGELAAWMALLNGVGAGRPALPPALAVEGDASAVDRLLAALR